jgi:hypothetical protein
MSKDALAVARRQIESLQDGELQAAQHGTESDLISLYRPPRVEDWLPFSRVRFGRDVFFGHRRAGY